jgi:hypothetical protein
VSLEVVVHVELGVLVVDDFRDPLSVCSSQSSVSFGYVVIPVVVADILAVCDVLEQR